MELTNLTREEGGLYVCTADNGVTAPVERITRILVRRKEYNKESSYFIFLLIFKGVNNILGK